MKTRLLLLLLVLASGVLLSGCAILAKPAGIKVESDQVANVFIDGKLMGKTPYENADIKGKKEIVLKLIPEITETPLVTWEEKVKLLGGTWTSVVRELTAAEADSSGQVLYMENNKNKQAASLSITTDPSEATVLINQEDKGLTPLEIRDLSPQDYTIEIKKDGYVSRNMKLKLLAGYKLNVEVKLGQAGVASGSSTITDQSTATVTTAPSQVTPTPKSSNGEMARPYVVINDTELGFLRVREKPSTVSTELAQVKPGEKYSLLEEENGWYKIAYEIGKEGWVAGQYTTKYE